MVSEGIHETNSSSVDTVDENLKGRRFLRHLNSWVAIERRNCNTTTYQTGSKGIKLYHNNSNNNIINNYNNNNSNKNNSSRVKRLHYSMCVEIYGVSVVDGHALKALANQ